MAVHLSFCILSHDVMHPACYASMIEVVILADGCCRSCRDKE